MKRLTLYVTAAGVLIDATIIAYAAAERTQDGPRWLTALLLGSAGLVAVCGAAGAAFSAAWCAVSAGRYERTLAERRAADTPPSQARGTVPCPPSARYDGYWAEARRVATYAAGDAATTARHEPPLPATVPMPTVDRAAALTPPVPYAVRWDFDPTGPRTVVAEQWAGRRAA